MKSMKRTSWGEVAAWYDDTVKDDDSYQKNVLLPNILRVVGPKPGMTILDDACGQGYFSRAFAAAGAKVVAADISKELIGIAQKAEAARQAGAAKIAYHVAPSDKLGFVESGSVDAAVIVLALQNIERLAETLTECARALKPAGKLVIVLNHPAFRVPQASDWGWDDARKKQYRRIDAYMSDKSYQIDMNPGTKEASKKVFTVSFHRPLQTYFKAFAKAGLAATRLEEWISHRTSQKGPRAAEEDRTRKEIPLFLCIEVKKI